MSRRGRYIFAKKRRTESLKEIVVIVLLIIAIFFVALFIYFNLFGTASRISLADNLTAEINSQTMASDFIESIRGGTIKNDTVVDTSELGKRKISLTLDFDGSERDYDFDIEVVDTTPPTIDMEDSFTLLAGSAFDADAEAAVTDNSGSEVKVTLDGEVDTGRSGTYSVKLTAADPSGNTAEKSLTVNVLDPGQTEGDFSFVTAKGFTVERKSGVTTADGVLIVNKTFSLPAGYGPGGILYEAYDPLMEMFDAAAQEGISLHIVSGYRSYDTQNGLYKKYGAEYGFDAADTFSARPGYSEHQSGYAADLNSVDNSFAGTAEGKWIAANCYKYGFIIRYPEGKQDITGYIYEPWHVRYVGKDLAGKLYNGGEWITMEEYFGITSRYSD